MRKACLYWVAFVSLLFLSLAVSEKAIGAVLTLPAWYIEGGQASAHLGTSVAGAGDVNGDGFPDIVVGEPGFSNGEPGEGATFVFLGTATGLSEAPAWTYEGGLLLADLGHSVASAGDVNGDSYGDLVVGASSHDWSYPDGGTDQGMAFVFLGSPTGLGLTPAWTYVGTFLDGRFGYSVASAGDVNHDGFGDVVIGAPTSLPAGAVLVFLGSAAGLAAAPAMTLLGDEANSGFGWSVASAGDVDGDGDGFDDLLIGAPEDGNGEGNEGTVFLLHGNCDSVVDGDADGFPAAADPRCVPGKAADCDDLAPQAWATPGEVGGLALSNDPPSGITTLAWDPPGFPGGTTVRYDSLVSDVASDFVDAGACLESDGIDASSTEPLVPAPRSAYYYLVRAVNDCPAGDGPLGSTSSGSPRAALGCP